jgi:hypothetical protein
MTAAVRNALIVLALVLLLGLGAWYFFFAPSKIDSADLVPADTTLFLSVPNGTHVALDYETSHLKELVDSPNAAPLVDGFRKIVGEKNADFIQSILPDLSGQSFVAASPRGYILMAMRPKFGGDDVDGLLAKVKAAFPERFAEVTTTQDQFDGLNFETIENQSSHLKVCAAHARGWLVLASNEAALQDWWYRVRRNPPSPALAGSDAYKTAVQRTGPDAEALFYSTRAAKNPAPSGGFAVGTRFEGGDIVDRYWIALPRDAQNNLGLASTPCPFETLKFTGPDTRFYWGASFNWAQVWKNLQAMQAENPPVYPVLASLAANLQSWAQAHNLDVERNIIDPLGGEISLQAEWGSDSSYPDVGLFVKLDHPDDFKPVTAAIVDSIRQGYQQRAVVNELNAGGQNFATLKFLQPVPVSPTITEDGPYFGVFLNETHALNSFQRDASVGLLKNADFIQKIGDRQAKASMIAYLDAPRLLDRAYQTALPYLSLAAMFNPRLGSMVQGRNLPQDLHWLAPMGTWIEVASSDDSGITAYSSSGVGNQGVLFSAALRQIWSFIPGFGSGFAGASAFLPSAPAPPVVTPAPAPMTAPVTNAAPAAPQTTPASNAAPPGDSPNFAPAPTTNAPSAPATNE